MRYRNILIVLSFFVCSFILSSCENTEQVWQPINNNTIKIAIIGDKDYIADNGSMEAMQLAYTSFYEKTGIKIETIIYDDGANYNKGIECANQIAKDNTISAVIVKQELDYIDATAEIFEKAKKPFILTNGCYEHTIDNGYKYMIVDCINAKTAGTIMGQWVIDKGYKNVAFCHSNTEYEKDEVKGFQAKINDTSVKLSDTLIGPYTQEEFDIAFARWEILGIDAVCISNYDVLNSDIVRMIREKGSNIAVIGDYVMDTDEDILKNGEYLEGTAIVGMYINDINIDNQNVMDTYLKKYNMEMSEKAIQSYDIINLIGNALNLGIADTEQFISYIKQEKGYKGVSGILKFDDRGCLIPNGNEILVFKNGAFVSNT